MAIALPSPLLYGSNTYLRPISHEDAPFILGCRTDPRINRHLNRVSSELEEQQRWIRQQRERPNDYYFAICRVLGETLGMIGLYNVRDRRAELGRYVCIGAPRHAMEASILLEQWGFATLRLCSIYCTFRPENRTTRLLTRRYGWEKVTSDQESESAMETWHLTHERFIEKLPKWRSRIQTLCCMPTPTVAPS